MQITIFNTPIVSQILSLLAKLFLKVMGWRIQGKAPRLARYVLVGAPHTSNWDFVYGMAIGLATGVQCHWVGKHTLFWGPFNWVIRWMGGIPLDRNGRCRRGSLVEQAVCTFKQHRKLGLVICPEGTRARGERWHTGFYHMAKNAGVPIVLAFLDFKDRTGGFGPVIEPGVDIEKDLSEIQAFYSDIYGKHPECFSPVSPKCTKQSLQGHTRHRLHNACD
ncbi:lysophospholipid acyltransferase family protein [Endozoicomonas sp. GU-1]|uniref:lysophospholipid acyltransferase family protein n=1 Tax=Endozoicomonas sp. GU-1 TaxID=3009078 RepID=UPI0022B50E78|nr:lysophospholipid acyltransferase family protein [Endozoicomonas sp. GU-1]WBA83605.1 lysophospholipid acyltransferase family protein [Endozoicomonas sp. GU-1]